jgi:hypothetical protein
VPAGTYCLILVYGDTSASFLVDVRPGAVVDLNAELDLSRSSDIIVIG